MFHRVVISAPLAPEARNFISANITQVTLKLNTWSDGGCPIDHFSVQYKPKLTQEWLLLSNHIVAEQEQVVIKDLAPGSWFDLLGN